MATLRNSGVDVSGASVALTPEAASEYAAGPWAQDTPIDELFEMGERAATYATGNHPDEGDDADIWTALTRDESTLSRGGEPAECTARRKLLEKITRGLDAVRATALVAGLGAPASTDMLSAGGPGCGSAWASVPSRSEWRLVNSEFAMATQQRLGAARREPCSFSCQIKSSDGGGLWCAAGRPPAPRRRMPAWVHSGAQGPRRGGRQ